MDSQQFRAAAAKYRMDGLYVRVYIEYYSLLGYNILAKGHIIIYWKIFNNNYTGLVRKKTKKLMN